MKKTNIRTFSILGSRGTFGVTLLELAKLNQEIVALTADLCTTSGLDRFKDSYPNRFFNTGIAEQSMIGIAAGLSSGGQIPFCTTFSNFASLRACEQIRHFLGYMNENVKVVGLASGFAMGMFGVTHYGIEDIAAMRAISNLVILSPADTTETAKATVAAAEYNGPVYLRLTGNMNSPIVYKNDYDFKIGKSIMIKEGRDIVIVATGTMVSQSLKAAEILESNNISASIVDMHTIKPIDTDALDSFLGSKLIVTVEEHSQIGGLGSAVAEYYALKRTKPPHLIVGIPPGYPRAGSYDYLIEKSQLTPQHIAEKILRSIVDVS